MLLAGDEMARTQQGNNNAYCQDNDVSWVNWDFAKENADQVRFFQLMIAFRKRSPMLRRDTFAIDAGTGFHVTWHGTKRMSADWGAESRSVAMQWTQTHPDGSRDDLHFIAHAHWEDSIFELPDAGRRKWYRLVDTALESPQDIAEEGKEFPLESEQSYLVKSRSVVILVAK
jgi:isoamylase